MDKVSYAIGVNIGQNFKNQGLGINSDAISQGIKDGLTGTTPLISQQDMQSTLMNFQKELIVKRQQDFQQLSTKNKQDGANFLAANKTKPGVITLPDGLQYKIVTEGTGTPPSDQDTVTVNYEGTFIDGKVFDSSYQRKKPVTFPVSEIIPGWTEALKLMKPGATWQLFIPPNLAYGERGIGPIGPNQTLLFKVNLISVTKGTAAPTSQTANNATQK
jgi:FKBP-type peptidyl-prolyl cis-trans isomerase FklB